MIGAVAVAVVVAIVVVVVQVNQANRVQSFVLQVRLDSRIVLNEAVTDEQVGSMLAGKCDLISQGWTRDDVIDRAHADWPTVSAVFDVSEAQYVANTVGLFDAARPNC